MIYELRTYTVKPGTLGDMIKAASTISRDIRKDDYGKLEGYWSTEIGPLNQALHMWSYNSFDERTRMRAELAKNPRWSGEYVPLIRPLLVRQDVRLMNAVRPPVAPASTGNVYELRNYREAGRWPEAVARCIHGGAARAREIFKDRRPLDDRSGTAERSLPHLGLSQPERPCRSARQCDEGPGLAGIPRQGPGLPRGNALDHHAAGAAFAAAVSR